MPASPHEAACSGCAATDTKDSMNRIYDATIKRIDPAAPQTIIETPDGQTRAYPRSATFHKEGERGVLTTRENGDFSFKTYPDQRLRRAPEDDLRRSPAEEEDWLWCWTLDGTDRRILVKPHFVPGVDGQHIDDETDTIELAVPPELSELCESRGLSVAEVLRGFIADLCGLQDSVANPREDGYASNGSDERRLADAWFERAYPEGLSHRGADKDEKRLRAPQGQPLR
jgi:hypothetical protein